MRERKLKCVRMCEECEYLRVFQDSVKTFYFSEVVRVCNVHVRENVCISVCMRKRDSVSLRGRERKFVCEVECVCVRER